MRRLVVIAVFAVHSVAFCQAPNPLSTERYILPPKDIAEIVGAPRHLNRSYDNLNSTRTWFVEPVSAGTPTVEDISRPYLNLAGIQVDPAANRSRSNSMRKVFGYEFVSADGSKKNVISLPAGWTGGEPEWSPNGSKIAFLAHGKTETQLWTADPATLTATRVGTSRMLCTLTSAIEWSADGQSIAVVLVPTVRPGVAAESAKPVNPRVLVSDPTANRSRPLRDLLETERDQDLFEHYTTGQLAVIHLSTGKVTEIGKPGMIRSFSASPDFSLFRVTTTTKPFSYVVTSSSFGSKEEIIAADGKSIELVNMRGLQIAEPAPNPAPTTAPGGGRPGGGRPGGAGGQGNRPRGKSGLAFRSDGNGMVYTELEPADPKNPSATRKTKLLHWVAPYGKDDTKVLLTSEDSLTGLQWSADCNRIFYSRTKDSNSELVTVSLTGDTKPVVLSTSKSDEFYDRPGSLVSSPSPSGRSAVHISPSGFVFLSGTVYSKEPEKVGPRAFIDKVEIASGKKERIWQAPDGASCSFVRALDPEFKAILISHQSPTQVPNNAIVETASGNMRMLTNNKDFAPDVTKAQRYRIQITRADGFKFWANVTMPSWWVKGVKLPAMFWFYPSEFENQKAYDDGLRTRNINSFPNTGWRSMSMLTLHGYAVVEPDCPIVAPAARKNDPYISDLRNNLSATIDELEKQGFIDRSRLGLGGHSYGAFSTANAMIATPFFKAGIAGDGNYMRLLTPMAFQSENRTLWEARETYLNMSPLLFAEQLTGALLMYHGADDHNPGTHPINSERMFNALDGLGKDVALYVYPYEDHNAVAIETVQDMWARWIPWLEKYVMNANKPKPEPPKPAAEPTPRT